MLTYLQVHLYLLFPPTLLLLGLYRPLIGRRDALKIIWLCFMATLYTTPWDNWILSQSGWGYPAGSILGRIYHVPYEEHLFFLVHCVFLVLLHALYTHPTLLPFSIDNRLGNAPAIARSAGQTGKDSGNAPRETVQTLPRRPLAAAFWVVVMVSGGVLVNEAHQMYPGYTPPGLRYGRGAFYMGWILIWISPVVGWLTYLGAKLDRGAWKAWLVGSAWLCAVDTIAIRNGAWFISTDTTLNIQVVRGLPLEEFTFFLVVSYLVVLACSLISHLHTLLLLSPGLPPCPPSNPISHIALLARVALSPPRIDARVLEALVEAEVTLRRGSKSFDVAKLAFGREIRIGLVAMYAWCRVTDDLVDEPAINTTQARLDTLQQIRTHLAEVYNGGALFDNQAKLDGILDRIPQLSSSSRSAFYLFSAIVPRLVPAEPFFELCDGYETDIAFVSPTPGSSQSPLRGKSVQPDFDIDEHLPIKTSADLLQYADDVAGSIAAAICHLSWSILTCPDDPAYAIRPVEAFAWTASAGGSQGDDGDEKAVIRRWTIRKAREMGQALQLVNISRDIAKDALIGRLYIPLSTFPSSRDVLDVLMPGDDASTSYAPYTLAYLNIAEKMRRDSIGATRNLPRTAKGGARAMAASYFEIAEAIKRNHGDIDERGIKVDKWRRGLAAARAFWLARRDTQSIDIEDIELCT